MMNASPAVLNAEAVAAAEPSRARLQGWLDLDHFDATSVVGVVEPSPGSIALSCPGLSVTFERGAVDWHAGDRAIVLVLGRPTVDGRAARAADLPFSGDSTGVLTQRLGGRYSIVCIDRTHSAVQLLTDRFAAWPLCWAQRGRRLVFADRADAVAGQGFEAIDAQALFDYVYFHMIPAPRTVFRGVARLEPSAELLFSGDGVAVRSTWQPEFARRRSRNVSDLAQRFRDTVRAAVADESAGTQAGCFLSGGTDSSTVAGMLKSVTGSASTFSIGFDTAGYDEMSYARIAARHFGTEHHEHYVTPAELVEAIPAVAAHYDQPFGNSSAVPAFICARLARESGVRKLLAGDGGDELFGGNSRYAKQKIFEAWWWLPEPARAVAAPLIANGLTRSLPIVRKAASYIDQASVPMPARMETYNLLDRFGAASVFTSDFLAAVDSAAPQALQAGIYARQSSAPFVDRMLAYDWRLTLADNDLPKVTGTTQLAGLAVGFPLLADALVDLSTELGPADKVRGLRLRHFFKESLVGFLPPEIIAKKKHGFGLPVGVWLVRDAAFRRLARDSVSELAARRLIRAELVDDLFSRRLEEHAGYYGEMVWILMMLEQWLSSRRSTLAWS